MSDAAQIVRDMVASHAPSQTFDDKMPLGGDGIGLDSIAIAEVLIACEERFGVELAALLEKPPLTIARITECVASFAR
jgi:acyl carrier protein